MNMSPLNISLSSAVVHHWHCDHYGHMNTRHYAALFDDAIFLFWGRLGRDSHSTDKARIVPVTAEMKTGFIAEAQAGTIVALNAQVIRVGSKSVSLRFEMTEPGANRLLATCDVVEVFFDTHTRSSQPIPNPIRQQLQEVFTPLPA